MLMDLKSLFGAVHKRKETIAATMRPSLNVFGAAATGEIVPCRVAVVTGITCVVGVIGSALLLLQGVKYFR